MSPPWPPIRSCVSVGSSILVLIVGHITESEAAVCYHMDSPETNSIALTGIFIHCKHTARQQLTCTLLYPRIKGSVMCQWVNTKVMSFQWNSLIENLIKVTATTEYVFDHPVGTITVIITYWIITYCTTCQYTSIWCYAPPEISSIIPKLASSTWSVRFCKASSDSKKVHVNWCSLKKFHWVKCVLKYFVYLFIYYMIKWWVWLDADTGLQKSHPEILCSVRQWTPIWYSWSGSLSLDCHFAILHLFCRSRICNEAVWS